MSSNFIFHENDDRFYVKKSTIKNAGHGLFAKKKLLKDEKLMISGVLVEKQSQADICTNYADCYKFAASIVNMADGKIECGNYKLIPLGFAGLVNHGSEGFFNAEITYFGNNEVAYVFTKDIDKDEEILGDYGDTWNQMINWSNTEKSKSNIEKPLWEKFLDYNVYELGELK